MNNTFDWNRFCEVVKKDLRNMWPMFGTTILILAALPFAVWLFMAVLGIDNAMPPDGRLIMIGGVTMLTAFMTPSRLYRTWNLRNEGIYFAMLPASKLEKFCSAILFSLIICPLIVFLGSMALDLFLTLLPFGPWRDWLWQGEIGFPFTVNIGFFDNTDISGENAQMFGHYFTLWVIGLCTGHICSVLMFIFTSTLFKKHKVLQTILWLYVIEFVLSVVFFPISIALVATDSMENLMEWFTTLDAQSVLNAIFWVAIAFNVLLAVLFGWLSWRRLKKMPY